MFYDSPKFLFGRLLVGSLLPLHIHVTLFFCHAQPEQSKHSAVIFSPMSGLIGKLAIECPEVSKSKQRRERRGLGPFAFAIVGLDPAECVLCRFHRRQLRPGTHRWTARVGNDDALSARR